MKGSPGGILLIGVGIVLLSLGWTGRFAAVWSAITGGGSGGTGTGSSGGTGSGTTPAPPADCADGLDKITVGGQDNCYRKNQQASPENNQCRSGYTLGTRAADGVLVCVSSTGSEAPGGGPKPTPRCVEQRAIPAGDLGIQTADWTSCCTKETILYNPDTKKYICTHGATNVQALLHSGWQQTGVNQGAGSASITMLPTGFATTRYVPNGTLYAQ